MEITTTLTKKGRINVFADGEYQFTVSSLFWQKNGCPAGAAMEPEELAALSAQAENEAAYGKAVRLLSLRAHGERELLQKLCRDHPKAAAEAAVERCRREGYVDDEAFARAFAEERFRLKGYAPSRIEAELRAKGVDREISQNAVFSLDIDRKNGIIRIIQKMRLPPQISAAERDRMIRRLLSAGYTMREIRETVEFSGGEPEEP